MVLSQKQTHIAYRCPGCGFTIYGMVGGFALSADMLRLKCQCGESELSLSFTSDKKIRLSVPCLFCNTNHTFVLSRQVFFGEKLFLCNCPYTNMDIAFIGEKEEVDAAVERSANELDTLFAQMGISSLEDLHADDGVDPEQILTDAQIYDIVRFVIRDLADEEKINCPCGEGPYDFEMVSEGVRIFCEGCGAEVILPVTSLSEAEQFIHLDSVTLPPRPTGHGG